MNNTYKEIYENLFPNLESEIKGDEDTIMRILYKDEIGEYFFRIDQYIPGYYSITITVQWNNSQNFHPYDFKISEYKPGQEIASELNSALAEIKKNKEERL